MGTRTTDDASDPSAALTRSAVLFRVVKLLRMLKLARILRALRVMQRVALDIITNQWEWTFARLKMGKLTLVLITWAHWQACLWALGASYLQHEGVPTWLDRFETAFSLEHEREPMPLDRYSAALSWSIMTLTAIGVSDELTAANTAERLLACVYMIDVVTRQKPLKRAGRDAIADGDDEL